MMTRNFKYDVLAERPRHGESNGILIARMAILFAITCTVATLVMLAG
jgi:hypothetical protein